MYNLFDNMAFENIMIYLDDILIVSKTKEENINPLNKVFQLMSKNNITLNLFKCSFLKEKISFLRYQITSDGISPEVGRIEAVKTLGNRVLITVI